MTFPRPVTILFAAAVTLVNCVSVKLATAVQNVFCFCKVLAIFIIIGGGIYRDGGLARIERKIGQESEF